MLLRSKIGSILLLGIIFSTRPSHAVDPADGFEVLRVVSDARHDRNAVVYRYDHANSSRKLVGVWIFSGAPPAIGSREAAQGTPVIIYSGPDHLNVAWAQSGNRLLISQIGSETARTSFNDCYFDYEHTQLCIDPERVEVRP